VADPRAHGCRTLSVDAGRGADVVVRDLTVRYRRPGRGSSKRRGLDALSLDLAAGSITALRGANGAGKTTLLLALLGAVAPSSGTVEIGGFPPVRYRTSRGIGFLPAACPVPRGWTGRALLAEGADLVRLRGRQRKTALESAEAQGPHSEHWDRPLESLSTGLLRRLLFAYTLLGDPALVLLDEPFAGLDRVGRRRVEETLGELAARGTTVVLASHEELRTERRVDRVVVLEGGRRVS